VPTTEPTEFRTVRVFFCSLTLTMFTPITQAVIAKSYPEERK